MLYSVHSNHLGSTTLLTDQSGAEACPERSRRAGRVYYSPYGSVISSTGALPTDRLFTGQRWEPDLGLYDYRARFYDPLVGSFISADTLVPEVGHPRGWNRYGYVYGNPVRYSDPSGHCGKVYTGNIDMNASINQRCYEMAEEFTNAAASAGFEISGINEYNIDVISEIYRVWRETGSLSQVQLPPPETLPVGQPFKVTSTFMGWPDPYQAGLDGIGGIADVVSWIAVVASAVPGVATVTVPVAGGGQAVSAVADIASIGYQLSKGFESGIQQAASIGRKQAAMLGAEHSRLLGHQVGGLVPMIGIAFDYDALSIQHHQGSVLSVFPTTEWPDIHPNIGFNNPNTFRPSTRNRGFRIYWGIGSRIE